jgi:hypothetical protein
LSAVFWTFNPTVVVIDPPVDTVPFPSTENVPEFTVNPTFVPVTDELNAPVVMIPVPVTVNVVDPLFQVKPENPCTVVPFAGYTAT